MPRVNNGTDFTPFASWQIRLPQSHRCTNRRHEIPDSESEIIYSNFHSQSNPISCPVPISQVPQWTGPDDSCTCHKQHYKRVTLAVGKKPKPFIMGIKHACHLLWRETLFLLYWTVKNFPFSLEECFPYARPFKNSLEKKAANISAYKMCRNTRPMENCLTILYWTGIMVCLSLSNLFSETKTGKWLG